MPHYLLKGADFTDDCKEFTVPNFATGGYTYSLEEFFRVVDDDIDEVEQSFALIAILGSDVPDGTACFQERVGDLDCINDGRRGVTRIRITDNDRTLLDCVIQYISENMVADKHKDHVL